MTPLDTALLLAIQMPTGGPMTMQMTTDSSVMMSVSMLSDHSPTTPKESMARVTRIVDRRPATTKVTPGRRSPPRPSQPDLGHPVRGGAGI